MEGGREDNQVLTLNSFFRTLTATIHVDAENDRPLVIVRGGIKQILDSSWEGITTNAVVVATAMVATAMVATATVATPMEAPATTMVATPMVAPATTMVAPATTITEDTAVAAKDASAPN